MADEGTKNDEPSGDCSVTLSPRHRVTLSSHHPVTLSSAHRVARLARKELSEILRDRRTIVTLVAMPLLLYPLLSVAFLQFAWVSKADAARGQEYVFGFARVDEARVFFDRLDRGQAELQKRPGQDAPAP